MKKHGILNSEISSVLGFLGHTDTIVICDAGLPIPSSVQRIDISLRKGIPSFIDVLQEVLQDMVVESALLASELQTENPYTHTSVSKLLGNNGISCEYVSHEALKELTGKAKAIIRTGECSPYANIILRAGVIF